MKKNVLLAGGFLKARSLAQSLVKKGYQITVINNNEAECLILAEIEGVYVIQGDATKPFVLDDASAQDMDIAIALTHNDFDNLVICELCKKMFKVAKVVSLVSDQKKTDFFYKMGVDSVVCATNTITRIIEQQAFMQEMENAVSIAEGLIQITELLIPGTAPVVGKKLWEINLPKDVIVGCILRNEDSIVPSGNTRILSGDLLVLITSKYQQLTAIKELIGGEVYADKNSR